ncbi:NAD(P)/FAD-dependent oxidoreductase [Clostridiaceae bacterium]|mgnify:FL=1|nr:NAD(P)/FAD-dependent oxidoreductase [Lachnospiraceae bacterium]NBH16863.1 NAD(P)/FAD-dependent oxidoreductase [Clostridiaceae bacterium]
MGNVVIVGGGAAGMMAAVAAARSGHLVRIYEKNEKLGKKIYITGKGRCNVTNACETEELFAGMVSNPKFLYSGFYGFTSQDMMRFLEENGCPVKVERGNRVFPVSDKSSDVIRAITGQLSRLGVEICLGQEVSGLMARDGQIQGIGLKKGERKVPADAVIVASGGLSYPSTGSTGDGYEFARSVGHKVTELSPALTPLEVREQTLVQDLQGLSLKNVRVQIWDGKKIRYEAFGEMLFTHFGVSGPVILSASSYVAKELKKRAMVLTVDLKPALDLEQLDSRILRDFEGMKQKMFKNALGLLLPSKLIPVIVGQSEIPPEKPVNAISRKERRQLAERIKNFRLTLTGLRGYREAIITQGGVSVKEINPKTMESKLIRGLHFAGEVLDLDGVTGGYNLQIAWSTGYLAGRSV